MKTLTIRVSDAEFAAISAEAQRELMPVSVLLRRRILLPFAAPPSSPAPKATPKPTVQVADLSNLFDDEEIESDNDTVIPS